MHRQGSVAAGCNDASAALQCSHAAGIRMALLQWLPPPITAARLCLLSKSALSQCGEFANPLVCHSTRGHPGPVTLNLCLLTC
jgi:hypothetical protein